MTTIQIIILLFWLGTIAQMFSMFRSIPKKENLTIFFCITLFFGLAGAYSYLTTSASLTMPISDHNFIIISGFSYASFIVSAFAISFYNQILETIDEGMMFSMIISFWILFGMPLFGNGIFSYKFLLICLAVTGLSIYSLVKKKNTSNLVKWVLYSSYIFIMMFFSLKALIDLGIFDLIQQSSMPNILNFKNSLSFFLSGMTFVLVITNIIHLVQFFSVFSDKQGIKINKIFTNKQTEHQAIKWILISQVIYIALFNFLVPGFGFEVLLSWVLIIPIISRVWNKILFRKRIS